MWREIGLSLNVDGNVLDGLENKKVGDIVKLAEIIDILLATSTSFITWNTVIDAIKGPVVKKVAKADEIRQYVTKVKFNIMFIEHSLNTESIFTRSK